MTLQTLHRNLGVATSQGGVDCFDILAPSKDFQLR